mgnify:CR=1 FL=1
MQALGQKKNNPQVYILYIGPPSFTLQGYTMYGTSACLCEELMKKGNSKMCLRTLAHKLQLQLISRLNIAENYMYRVE